MPVIIYHNPRCGKSRQTLALLQDRGIFPVIVDYLKNPPSETELKDILKKLDMAPRALMRKGEAVYGELHLDDPALSDHDLLRAMAAHPVLIERPVVIAGAKAAVGRPPEAVLAIL